jgi:VanZ family protein
MTVTSAWKVAGLWGALILTLTSLPAASVPDVPPFPHLDKLVHGGLYGVLAILAARAMSASRPAMGSQGMSLLLTGIAVFGALDEWHQKFIPGRVPAWSDWSADVLGAMVGVTIFQLARARREISGP